MVDTLTQDTAGRYVSWNADGGSAWNNQPTITSTNNENLKNLSLGALVEKGKSFTVYFAISASGSLDGYIWFLDGSTGKQFVVKELASTANKLIYHIYASGPSWSAGLTIDRPANSRTYLCVRSDGADLTISANDRTAHEIIDVAWNTNRDTGPLDNDDGNFFARSNLTNDWNGVCGGIWVYDEYHSDTTVEKAEAYLQSQFGAPT